MLAHRYTVVLDIANHVEGGPAPDLPLHPDTAVVVLGIGLAVFALVAYDVYRREVSG